MDDLDFGATIRGFSPGHRLFDRYVLKEQLGRGGMGVVWLARDEVLEREVAIKMLPEVVASDPAAIRDLKRETSRSQQLSHPHILRIYDFVQAGSLCGITMEVVEGGTLTTRRLEQPGEVFSVGQLRPWVEQLCNALDYAHAKVQIVHRDLKPANLMLDRNGDLKVADFGIAASVSDTVSRVSAQLSSSGTPVYMSPQQMMGERPAVSDDVYSLGATLYELLTGKPPFYSGNVIAQVQGKAPPSIAERRKELGVDGEAVPPEWEETIAACLAKEAGDRPEGAGEVARRLGLTVERGGLKVEDRGLKGDDAPLARVTTDKSRMSGDKERGGRKKLLIAGYWLLAALLILAGAGYYFGVYAPEQRRVEAERARLAAEAEERLRQEQEAASARTEREEREFAMILGRIDAVVDGAPASMLEETEAAVQNYLEEAPERYHAEALSRWASRASSWEAVRLAAARGGIVVRTNPPGAEVRVGALALDASPLTLRDQRLGEYPVVIRMDGYEEWRGEIEVKENEFTELEIVLERSKGTVTLTTSPREVEVLVRREPGGELIETVVAPYRLDLPTGTYSLEFQREGWLPRNRRVEVDREAAIEVSEIYYEGERPDDWLYRASLPELEVSAEGGDLAAMVEIGDRIMAGMADRVDAGRARGFYRTAAEENYVPAYSRLGRVTVDWEERVEWTRLGAAAGDPVGLVRWTDLSRLDQRLANDELSITDEQMGAAVSSLERKADLGGVEAMFLSSYSYYRGFGVSRDYEEAARRFRHGVEEAGDVRSMNFLGYMYLNGWGTEQDDSKAISLFRRAAEAGDSGAMNNLGIRYRNGRGVERDDAEAAKWYRRAAEAGNADAMTNLAALYANGNGVPQDDVEAVKWYRRGAEAGNASAMNNLGIRYRNGNGVERDDAEAAKWYRRAAEAGNAAAMRNLGWLYDQGYGVNKDDVEAVKWYRKGAEAGDASAMNNLGASYANGEGVPRDDVEAVKWYRRAAEAGNALAMNNLGVRYRNGNGVERDDAEAAKWYRRAAEAGNAAAMRNLGYLYDHGYGVDKDDVEAVKWYRKGAEAGDASAMNNLGIMYRNGRGNLPKSDAEAVKWYRQGAEGGSAGAMANLGFMYANGHGIRRNDAEAVKWYRRGAEGGSSRAMNNLGVMYAGGRGGLRKDEDEAIRWYREAARAGSTQAQDNLRKRNLSW